MGNIELFELCETIPKVQCSECLLSWNQGVIYCTYGHLLVESESSQYFDKGRLDTLSIPHHVIRMKRHHGAWHGITEAKEHFVSHNARKRCIKKNYERIHERFLRSSKYRDSQLKIGWTKEKCIAMDKLAQEDHSYRLSSEEFERYQKNWYLTLNKSGKNAPTRLRSDFRATITIMNRFIRESGEERAEPIPFRRYQKWHLSSSSLVELGQKLVELMRIIHVFWLFVAVGSFTADSCQLQPTGRVNRTPHTSPFSRSQRARTMMCDTTLAQMLVRVIPSMCPAPEWLFVLSPFPHLVLFRVFLYLPLLLPEPWLPPFPLLCGCLRSKIPYALRQMRSLAAWPTTPLSQVMSPTSSTISTTQRPIKSSSKSNPATQCPRTCMTRSCDETIGRALSSPLFIQEREEPADRKQAYHSFEESLLKSIFVCRSCKNGETRAWT